MNLARHLLHWRNTTGTLLTILPDSALAGLAYTLKVNEPGVCDIVLPGDFDPNFLMIDGQFEIERAYAGGTPVNEGQTAWFVRKIVKGTDTNGTNIITLTAFTALHLMQRRIIAYYAGSSYTEKMATHWDDMLREIVKENYGALAQDTERNLSPWLTVEADQSIGASFQRSMPWRYVINVLQDIVADVRAKGTYCTFDVVRTGPAAYEFRVFVGPRGTDHSDSSASPVIVSQERKNLLQPSMNEDWQEEKNYIYATGQGQQDQRVVKTARDDTRIAISPFNRHEFNRDARQDSLDESVQAEAYTALEEFRPQRTFTGTISQTEGCIYGVHWGWGDIVTAEYRGFTFDCYVETVTVEVLQDGTEIVTGALRSVNNVG